MVARRALIAVSSMLAAVVPMLTRILAARALRMLRWALARKIVGRTLKAPERLTQRFDLALVGGLLAFGLLEQFEQFVELVQGIAQGGDNLHDFVDGLSHRRRLRRLKISRRPWGGSVFAVRRPGSLRSFLRLGFRRLVGDFHLRGRRIELLVVPAGRPTFVLHLGGFCFRGDGPGIVRRFWSDAAGIAGAG